MNRKSVIVTGTSSGVGEAFVKICQEKNLHVTSIGRNSGNFIGENFNFFECDFKDVNNLKELFSKILSMDYEYVALVNNAGYAVRGTIQESSVEEYEDTLHVNFLAPTLMASIYSSHLMNKKNKGHIVNVSSIAEFVDTPTLGVYAVSKCALKKSMNILRKEVEGAGIKVSCINPGAIKTRFGKNIRECSNKSSISIYTEWEMRFKNYFKIHSTSFEIAMYIFSILRDDKEVRIKFFCNRDRLIYYSYKFLPVKMFDFFISNIFYRL